MSLLFHSSLLLLLLFFCVGSVLTFLVGFAYLGNGDVKATASGDVEGLSTYMRSWDHEWDVE